VVIGWREWWWSTWHFGECWCIDYDLRRWMIGASWYLGDFELNVGPLRLSYTKFFE